MVFEIKREDDRLLYRYVDQTIGSRLQITKHYLSCGHQLTSGLSKVNPLTDGRDEEHEYLY